MKFILNSIACLIVVVSQVTTISILSANDELWNALKSGNHLVLLRHALAPGISDPKNFDVMDCSTQRNLNNEGRVQARAIGELFRVKGINALKLYSSHWCRCAETARLLELGEVKYLVSLNSFFEHFHRKQQQTKAIQRWITTAPLTSPTLLVTHQVNITALTGFLPSSGELIFVKRRSNGKFLIIGTIETLR